MNRLASAAARPFLVPAIDAALGFSRLPLPSDRPRVHAPGPDADRLLLVGTASVVGVGVATHELGLGGHLARSISALTRRGVDVQIEGSLTFTVLDAIDSLSGRSLGHFDAVVLMVGSRESIAFHAMRTWKSQLRRLLRMVLDIDGSPHAFVIATPPIARYGSVPIGLVDRLQRHTDLQNSVTESVCAEFPNATYLTVARPFEGGGEILGSALYEKWAAHLAASIAPRLDAEAHRMRTQQGVDETARQAALDALHVVGSGADRRIDQIARTARDLLGASGASVTLLDHDRQWIKSAVSMSSKDTERASSFCNATITRPELFVVEDAAADDTFAGHPWVVGEEQVRFYAGYPVEAPNGERVGALCVVDTKPRQLSDAEAALLRELALRVQTVLWAG